MTVPKAFLETVKRHPDRTCLAHEGRRWSFQDLEDFSNRVANCFLAAGFKPGDCIAMFMENR